MVLSTLSEKPYFLAALNFPHRPPIVSASVAGKVAGLGVARGARCPPPAKGFEKVDNEERTNLLRVARASSAHSLLL